MVNKTDGDEYFFDDADVEHLGSDDSDDLDEAVIYEHEGDAASVDDSSEFEDVSLKWQMIKDQTIAFVIANKRIVLIVIVALLALIGVHYMLPSKEDAGVKATNTHQAVQKKPQPVFEPSVPAFSPPLSNVNSQVSKQSEAIKTLAHAMDTIVDKQEGNQKQIAALLKRIDQLTAQLAPAKAAVKQKIRRQENKHFHPPITFYVRAIQPGRAWLLGSDNSSISVSEGSVIPGYGQVTNIDSDSGQVATDGGHTIGFSPERIS